MSDDIHRPIEHRCGFGTVFKSKAKLQGGVDYIKPEAITEEQFASDCAEFGAWHAMEIWPGIKNRGFPGYALRDYVNKGWGHLFDVFGADGVLAVRDLLLNLNMPHDTRDATALIRKLPKDIIADVSVAGVDTVVREHIYDFMVKEGIIDG